MIYVENLCKKKSL